MAKLLKRSPSIEKMNEQMKKSTHTKVEYARLYMQLMYADDRNRLIPEDAEEADSQFEGLQVSVKCCHFIQRCMYTSYDMYWLELGKQQHDTSQRRKC